MAFKRPSLEEKLSQQSSDIFVGREEILLDFFREDNQAPLSLETYKVCSFYGVGGIGKTALRKEMVKRIQQNLDTVGVLNFETKEHQKIDNALIHLRKSLGKKYKINFAFFDIAYSLYMNKAYPNLALNDSSAPLLDESDFLLDVINTVKEIPGISLVPKIYNLYHKGHKLLTRYLNERKMSYLSLLSDKEASELLLLLPQIFSEDLMEYIQKNSAKVYIFIDTYEALWEDQRLKGDEFYVDEWIREWIQVTPGVTWVIFGRERLRWAETDKDWNDVIVQKQLTSLGEEVGAEILRRHGIHQEEIISTILGYSKGLPYSIELSVDLFKRISKERAPVKEDFQFEKNVEKLFTRFMKYLTKGERRALELLALTRSWDRQLFTLLVKQFDIGFYADDFDDLIHFSFIKMGADGRWEMHSLMRESLRDHIGNHKFMEGNQFLFQYFSSQLRQYEFKSTVEKPSFWLDESFFHGFSLAVKNLMPLEEFVEWFRAEDSRFFNYGKWEVSIPLHQQLINYLDPMPTDKAGQLLAIIVYDLAFIYFKQTKYQEAEKQFRKAVDLAEKVYGPNNSFTAKTYYGLATIFHNQGKYEEAEPLYLESLRIREQVLGANHLGVALSANNLATLYQDMGRLEEAEPLYLKSIEIRKRPENFDERKIAAAYISLVYFYHHKKEYEDAAKMGLAVIKFGKKVFGMTHINFSQALNHLGNVYIRQGKYRKSLNLYLKALQIVVGNLGDSSAEAAKVYHNLAVLSFLLSKQAAVTGYMEKCLEIKKEIYGDAHFRYLQSVKVREQIDHQDIIPDGVYLDF
ncbi:tetratricopeptide repeat protein [Neobacillus citreus]|uniref:Tetratricopeptide repeat protein n=1 Tax=Neobacillus citreus TaxID=2833578 RepID=A0A942YDP3_9BACI|nr:tetratricopeptide repeat protein [Neobacillus citreus]MCH6266074.1 tetratricopeptide repeat protein [Neobacillus citreus]